MASTASVSESSSTSTVASTSSRGITASGSREQAEVEQRPQAGPLPLKTPVLVGEIGYLEETAPMQNVDLGDGADDDTDSTEGLNAAEADARNGRHPADRSRIDLASASTTSLPNRTASLPRRTPPNLNETSSLHTTSKHSIFSLRSLSSRLSVKTYFGVTRITLIRLCLLIFVLGGLIVAWVFAAQHLIQTPTGPPNSTQTSGTSAIFVHVAFAILALLLIIFIERTVFRFRAERYAYLHPGQILPSHRHGMGGHMSNGGSGGMAFAPWNRPPLPTYAAALGVRGTGDVEDAIIAAPPPPAYGNTRGSTLILASLLRNSRGSIRSHGSTRSRDAPWQMVSRPGADGRMSDTSARGLPISYDEAEHHSDVERARVLEEALAKLEEGSVSRR